MVGQKHGQKFRSWSGVSGGRQGEGKARSYLLDGLSRRHRSFTLPCRSTSNSSTCSGIAFSSPLQVLLKATVDVGNTGSARSSKITSSTSRLKPSRWLGASLLLPLAEVAVALSYPGSRSIRSAAHSASRLGSAGSAICAYILYRGANCANLPNEFPVQSRCRILALTLCSLHRLAHRLRTR